MAALPSRRLAQSPLMTLAVCLATGIVLVQFAGSRSRVVLCGGIVFLAFVSVVATFCLFYQRRKAASIFLAIAFIAGGVVLASLDSRALKPNRISRLCETGKISRGEPVELSGTVEGQPEPAPQSFYLTVKAERIKTSNAELEAAGSVLLLARLSTSEVKAEYDALELRHGAKIRLLVTLDRDDEFRNPGVRPLTEYLERTGYDATGLIKSPLLIERLDDARVFLPLAWLYDWRQGLQQQIHRLFSAEAAGVLDAALLGNHYNISHSAAERFRVGGTFHVLVISGLQIAFIGGVVLIMTGWFTRRKAWQFVLTNLFLWAYAIAVGADPSVTRSAFMFTLVVLAPMLSRRAHTLNGLGGAAIALLIFRPADLFDPSFQLTFVSVLSIVTISVPLIKRMEQIGSWRPAPETPYPPDCARRFRIFCEILFWNERQWQAEMAGSQIRYRLFKSQAAKILGRYRLQQPLRFATTAVVVSASVQIGMLPLLIIYFHRFSLAALLLNIFVGVLMALLSLLALAAVLVSVISYQWAVPLLTLAEKTNWLMIHLVDPVARLGVASLRMPHYHGWLMGAYVIYTLLLLFLVMALERWRPLSLKGDQESNRKVFARRPVSLAVAAFAAVFILIVQPLGATQPDGRLHVEFLDVGQGDCALLTMPDGTTLMIDGGGRPNLDWSHAAEIDAEEPFERDARSIGERVVSEYLWARGLDRVDYILATHADADHIDGLSDVARNFKVRAALVARTPAGDPGYARFATTMKQMRVPLEVIGAGDVLQFGQVSAQVLWPPANNSETASSRNNDSVVLRFSYGNRVMLFTGDVEKEAELALLGTGLDLQSTVVKVAHHGSKTSSLAEFVAATHPSLAIISVGRNSIFGHPNREVIERWRAGGTEVLTTGERGTISVITDGRSMNVSTFVRQ